MPKSSNVLDAEGDIPTRSYLRHNQRMFGGTSTVWNGQCAVLEKTFVLEP